MRCVRPATASSMYNSVTATASCPVAGLLDWPEIFGALADMGYDGYVSLECSTGPRPRR